MHFAVTVLDPTNAFCEVSSCIGKCRPVIGISSIQAIRTSINASASGVFRHRRFFRRYLCDSADNKNRRFLATPTGPRDVMLLNTCLLRVVEEEEASVTVTPDGQPPKLLQSEDYTILSACAVGLLTGLAVVLFNYGVHEIRDLCWGEIPDRGASWLREEPLEMKWMRVILIPASGGLLVSLLNLVRAAVEDSKEVAASSIMLTVKPILKTVAACVTLGTGNSLGPEGPSVEIGDSVAKGIGTFFNKGLPKKLALRAAGAAAGLSSGFGASVAGCFFAVESVLWPSPAEPSLSLTNATSMVILSAVIASVISEVGLGSEPTFSVPIYEFLSPSELPLYLLLGILCGLVSLVFSKFTSFMLVGYAAVQRNIGIPKAAFPIAGGFAVGLIAIAYPEILYWGFENVDTLLESRLTANSLSPTLLLQLVAAKIVASSVCRASGLVGGYYAPSLFIGAATGMAYGKIVSSLIHISDPIFHIPFLQVASPQAYGLVGMAATLAGVCQVPLTAVLLLFELTQDYRIVLPLLGAVGLSSWVTFDREKNKGEQADNLRPSKFGTNETTTQQNSSNYDSRLTSVDVKELDESSLCEVESSLCLGNDSDGDEDTDILLASEIPVSQAMRRRYVTTMMTSYLIDAVLLMLEEKHSYAMILDDNNRLCGHLTLQEIQQFLNLSMRQKTNSQVLTVSDLCTQTGKAHGVSYSVSSEASLLTAMNIMKRQSLSHLPVILEVGDNRGMVVGLLDTESVDLVLRAFAIREELKVQAGKDG